MKVITAIENYERQEGDILCFLAGGISNCPDWQSEVIEELQKYDCEYLVLFNPRRKDFPIHDPNAAKEQITWEFENLQIIDIFSMYFCNSETIQPICMYELGRNLARMEMRFPNSFKKRIAINVEKGYSRAQDVLIQTKLATQDETVVYDNATPKFHAAMIYALYNDLKN